MSPQLRPVTPGGENPVEQLAVSLKAAADPLRLDILRVLARNSFGVLELSRIFNTTQSGMSHHLKVLANGGLVASRREGNSIYYRRAHAAPATALHALQTTLYASLDQLPLHDELKDCLSHVQEERTGASREFFAANADKFREQQDLIASYDVYAEHVRELLQNINLEQRSCALELGPGQGEFLAVLSSCFDKVVAVDNSPRMLEQAQNFTKDNRLGNVECLLGDSSTAVDSHVQANCVVANMVLHHTSSPADIFYDVSQVLLPGGVFIVTDLCRHDQGWATESCGDLWLGFEPEDLSHWARECRLAEGQSVYFALRNGFQIQIRQFAKPRF